MWNDDEIDQLPEEDDEAAFIQVMRLARSKADRGIDDSAFSEGHDSRPYIIGYFSAVRAAAKVYEVDALADLPSPDPADRDLLDQYHRLTAQVDEAVLQLQLMRKRNPRTYSVAERGRQAQPITLLNKSALKSTLLTSMRTNGTNYSTNLPTSRVRLTRAEPNSSA